MLTKQAVALLALGGGIRAWRVFPHPYHYGVALDEMATHALAEDDVIALLAAKRVAPPPVSLLGDAYGYSTVGEWARVEALRDHRHGFGVCEVCGAFPLRLNEKGVAVRHGFTRQDPTPCAGSGRACSRAVLPTPVDVQVAA